MSSVEDRSGGDANLGSKNNKNSSSRIQMDNEMRADSVSHLESKESSLTMQSSLVYENRTAEMGDAKSDLLNQRAAGEYSENPAGIDTRSEVDLAGQDTVELQDEASKRHEVAEDLERQRINCEKSEVIDMQVKSTDQRVEAGSLSDFFRAGFKMCVMKEPVYSNADKEDKWLKPEGKGDSVVGKMKAFRIRRLHTRPRPTPYNPAGNRTSAEAGSCAVKTSDDACVQPELNTGSCSSLKSAHEDVSLPTCVLDGQSASSFEIAPDGMSDVAKQDCSKLCHLDATFFSVKNMSLDVSNIDADVLSQDVEPNPVLETSLALENLSLITVDDEDYTVADKELSLIVIDHDLSVIEISDEEDVIPANKDAALVTAEQNEKHSVSALKQMSFMRPTVTSSPLPRVKTDLRRHVLSQTVSTQKAAIARPIRMDSRDSESADYKNDMKENIPDKLSNTVVVKSKTMVDFSVTLTDKGRVCKVSDQTAVKESGTTVAAGTLINADIVKRGDPQTVSVAPHVTATVGSQTVLKEINRVECNTGKGISDKRRVVVKPKTLNAGKRERGDGVHAILSDTNVPFQRLRETNNLHELAACKTFLHQIKKEKPKNLLDDQRVNTYERFKNFQFKRSTEKDVLQLFGRLPISLTEDLEDTPMSKDDIKDFDLKKKKLGDLDRFLQQRKN